MLTDSSLHDTHNTPNSPLSSLKSSSQASSKGKKPIYGHLTWVRPRDPDSVDHHQNGSDSARPSLLDRMKPPLADRIQLADDAASASGQDDGLLMTLDEDGTGIPGEGEVLHVADEKMQDAPQTQTQAAYTGVRIKTEETLPTIPSPTRTERPVGRARGSRSTIDVFGEPTTPPTNGRRSSASHVTKVEDMADDSTVGVAVNVDAILATIFSPGEDQLLPVSNPPPLSPSDHREHSTSDRLVDDQNTTPVPASYTVIAPLLAPPPQPPPYPRNVLDSCRDILLPLVERNAGLRKHNIDKEVVKQRALALLSDDLCAEFVKLAKQVRTQLRDHKDSPSTPPGSGSSGSKRGRSLPDESLEPPSKVPRLDSPMVVVHTSGDMTVADGATITPTGSEADVEDLVEQEFDSRSPGHSPDNVPDDTTDAAPSGDVQSPPASRAASPTKQSSTTGRHPDVEHLSPLEEVSASGVTRTSPFELAPEAPNVAEGGMGTTDTSTASTIPDMSHHDPVTSPSTTTLENEPLPQLSIDKNMHDRNRDGLQQQAHPPCSVPGIWDAIVGRPSPGVEEMDIYVDDATADAAQCWAGRRDSFSLSDRYVKVHLLCLPQAAVESVLRNPTASPAEIATSLWNAEPSWPPSGGLVVKVNNSPNSTWFNMPYWSHLDITPAVRRGHNTISLIQLEGLSDRLFAIHAVEPTEEERLEVHALTATWVNISKKVGLPKS